MFSLSINVKQVTEQTKPIKSRGKIVIHGNVNAGKVVEASRLSF